jgi:NAD(P)H-hydrate epimerase
MKILTAAEMREVDRLTTERYGVPGLLLMEQAAAETIEAAESEFGALAGKRVLIICGKGNNGGDGAAIARQLHEKGAEIHLLLLGRASETTGDARMNFDAAQKLAAVSKIRFVEVETLDALRREAAAHACDICFDAIFGTGLTRPAEGIYEEAIRLINDFAEHIPVVAVDIPSGIASDSPELAGAAVRARLTVTFTAPKVGNILPPACDYNGNLVIAPIGSPEQLLASSGSRLNLIDRRMVSRWLESSRRTAHANKGDVGKVLVVAGSRGKTGAACLAGEAALRAGAGLVTVATPESSHPIVAAQLIRECMTEPLAETGSGMAAREAVDRVTELAEARDVLAIGPGLGAEESTRALVRAVALKRPGPLVIDADGLNALAPWGENLRGSEELPVVLTPHPGEMARLVGRSIPEVVANRIDLSREFATRHAVILVLKGSRTVIASPGGEVFINPTGNAGMATGGTGDVLTGIIAGLLAQKPDDALGATISAVYLHGLAGDIAATRLGMRALVASDVTAHLGQAFIEAGGDRERPGSVIIE